MDRRRRRHRHRRHHRLRPAAARRRRVRRAARAPARLLAKGGEAAVVEWVKAATEVYAPVSGEVVEVNAALPDAPVDGQRGPGGQRLVLQAQARRPGRARRPDGRGRLQDAYLKALIRCAICRLLRRPIAARCWPGIGVAAIDALFADVPAAKLLPGLLDLPRAKGELEVERMLGALAARNVAGGLGAVLLRRRRLPAPCAGERRSSDPALRVPDHLHALPARDRAGHAAVSVRVPDPGRAADRHGGRQRLDV